MGVRSNIDINTFPKQGSQLGKRVEVCFHYNTEQTIRGVIVRDDDEHPFIAIIRLDDGRYVLTTECQYSPLKETLWYYWI